MPENCDTDPIIRAQNWLSRIYQSKSTCIFHFKSIHLFQIYWRCTVQQACFAQKFRFGCAEGPNPFTSQNQAEQSDAGPPPNGQTSHRTDQLTSPSDQAVCLRPGPMRLLALPFLTLSLSDSKLSPVPFHALSSF